MNEHIIITIGRQYGSGGKQIAERLALKLSIQFYDKNLITMASKESGLAPDFFEKADEKCGPRLVGGIFGVHGVYANQMYSNNFLNNEALFQIQSNVIRELAQKQPAVFIGRCADYILKDRPEAIHLFITANIEDRCDRIATQECVSKDKALELIDKVDKNRAAYYNYYSNKIWGAAQSYHLCINSSVLGIEGTVEFICDFISRKR